MIPPGLRDPVVTWVAVRGDTRVVGALAHVGIRYEQVLRRALDLPFSAVRRLWGLAPQMDVDRTRERLSALEHRVRTLEQRAERKDDA